MVTCSLIANVFVNVTLKNSTKITAQAKFVLEPCMPFQNSQQGWRAEWEPTAIHWNWFIKAPTSSFDNTGKEKYNLQWVLAIREHDIRAANSQWVIFKIKQKTICSYNRDNLAIFWNGERKKRTVQTNFRMLFSDCLKPRHLMKISNCAASCSTSPAQHKSHYQTVPVRTYKIHWNMAV